MTKHFLVEIGLEEMPARFVTDAMNELKERTQAWLDQNILSFTKINAYSTPRRLALLIENLADKQPDQEEELKGPSKKIAVDENGEWTKPAIGFAKGKNIELENLYFKEIKGTEYVHAKKSTIGKDIREILPEIKKIITSIPFPKNMKWGNHDLKYVRPIKWLIAMYGEEIIPFEITNVHSSNISFGHRFLGSKVEIESAATYEKALLAEHVLVDPSNRKNAIRSQINDLSKEHGWVIPVDEHLLEEVNNLVEYPTALKGSFDEAYLNVPQEVLITSMREHQRYFPVQNDSGELLPHFITIRNGDHRHLENVQKGNEKVLRARLADAQFFYDEDLKKPLETLLPKLKTIVYHIELGSVDNKVNRIKYIADSISNELQLQKEEVQYVQRAAILSKADLVSHMVNEFPELEGKMGGEYATYHGEKEEVAKAISEQYLPKQSGDPLPKSTAGSILSIADKMDTVVSSFGIGKIPTGSQDPQGLRRQTAAILQMLNSSRWNLKLSQVQDFALEASSTILKREKEEIREDLQAFFQLRYKNLLSEHGISYDVIESVLYSDTNDVSGVFEKAVFMMQEKDSATFQKAVEAFSRVTNISIKGKLSSTFDSQLLEEKAEKDLFEKEQEVTAIIKDTLEKRDFKRAFQEMASLEPYINEYFNHVMVMSENDQVRENRLSHMLKLAELFISFADFRKLVIK